jgi:hypothetical protein
MNMPPHGYPQQPHNPQQPQGYIHPQAFAQGAAMQQSSPYEFGPNEDAEIGKTAMWAKAIGALGFVNAASQLLGGSLMGAIIAGAIGLLFFKGGTALASVVQTRGHDVHHVVSALDQFGQAFLARFIILVLTLVLALVAIPIILLVPAMLMGR